MKAALDTPLLDEVIEAHGGLARWRDVNEVSAHIRVGGALMAAKGKRRDHFSDCRVTVATAEQRVTTEPYPHPGSTGVFDAGAVRILDRGGRVVAEREDGRSPFFGLSGLARKLWWSDLDALYFSSYAMWNYLNTPFMLSGDGYGVVEGEEAEVEGRRCRRLDVTFPEPVHAHSRRQSFYFDDEGMLRRNDYTAQVVGGFARGAHFASGHRAFDGIVFPTSRLVLLRAPGGRPLPAPAVVTIELDSIALGWASPGAIGRRP